MYHDVQLDELQGGCDMLGELMQNLLELKMYLACPA